MSSEVAELEDVDETNSEFICFQQDLPIDDHNKVFMKIDLSTKNTIIDKLNELTQALFDTSLGNEQKIALLKENKEMVSTLNNLPVLVDSKAINYCGDCETNDAQSDVVALDGGDTRSNGRTHKFLKQIDILLNKVGKFDAKQDGIRSWFAKYELYSQVLGWTDEQRVASLSFFLDSGLFRIVQSEQTTDFNEIKDNLFEIVDDLLFVDKPIHVYNHMCKMINKLDQMKFSKPEQRYWLNCIYQIENIREYFEIISKDEDPLFKNIMSELLA